jgi:hypothetical protein
VPHCDHSIQVSTEFGKEEVNLVQAIKRDIEYKRLQAVQLPFEEIKTPGTYYSNWSGHLIRVPEDGLMAGRSPVIDILGKTPMIVTKLSDDPYMTLTKARITAADLDLEVNF